MRGTPSSPNVSLLGDRAPSFASQGHKSAGAGRPKCHPFSATAVTIRFASWPRAVGVEVVRGSAVLADRWISSRPQRRRPAAADKPSFRRPSGPSTRGDRLCSVRLSDEVRKVLRAGDRLWSARRVCVSFAVDLTGVSSPLPCIPGPSTTGMGLRADTRPGGGGIGTITRLHAPLVRDLWTPKLSPLSRMTRPPLLECAVARSGSTSLLW